jgi:hypothetical protein
MRNLAVCTSPGTVGGLSVPAGASRLLVIALYIFGHVVVDHKAYIGLVDAHAKGIGGNHHPGPVEDKVLLVLAALLVLQSGVVAGGGDPGPGQPLAYRLHRFSGGAVNNPALLGAAGQKSLQPSVLVFGAGYFKVEVGPVKACGHGQRVPQKQQRLDIRLDLGCGRGGKGPHHRAAGQLLHKLGDLQVTGPEILTPLRDAVGLIHGHQADFHVRGQL